MIFILIIMLLNLNYFAPNLIANEQANRRNSTKQTANFDSVKFFGAVKRVAYFYLILGASYWITCRVQTWWDGKEMSNNEARDFWHQMLIMGLVIELAKKAEGDSSIFNENSPVVSVNS